MLNQPPAGGVLVPVHSMDVYKREGMIFNITEIRNYISIEREGESEREEKNAVSIY